MNINEIVKLNIEIENLYQNEELTVLDYEENKEMLTELIQNKAEQIIFKQNVMKKICIFFFCFFGSHRYLCSGIRLYLWAENGRKKGGVQREK